MNYLNHITTPASQTERADVRQVQNSAGGYTFQIDDWGRLQRFLVLGSESGTYYASERKLTRENGAVIERLIKADGPRLVREIVALSESGRAPKNDPAILALAMAARLGDPSTRTAAHAAVPKICRIGTHLYHFVAFADQMGGWGRSMKRAVASWFQTKDAPDLAHQLVKYQQRDKWSARDLLRLSHPNPTGCAAHDALYSWATSGFDDAGTVAKHDALPPIIGAVEELKTATDLARVCALVADYKVPREAIPTQWLTKAEVWEAMLPHLGLTVMIRNLATMTRVGLLAPLSSKTAYIALRIADADGLKKARIHPVQMLAALGTYRNGRSDRGDSTWTPVQSIVDALDAGFYASFGAVTPTGKATLLALDVSGSMAGGQIAGIPGLTPRDASVAMALVTANVEPNYHIVGFSGGLRDLPISPRMRLGDAIRVVSGLPFETTDCALPFLWAQQGNRRVESFAVYTDNETYAGRIHPHVALKEYRQRSGLAAKSVVVGMTATEFTIADPTDAGMMDVVGFDASAPQIMSDFFS